MNNYNTIPYDPDILHRLRHHDKVPAAIRELDNISNIIRQNMSQAADEIERLQDENEDLIDTFRAIYDKLGIREGEVPGNEKVSVTVMKKINEIIERNTL